jgi:hypothetical protein
MDSMREHPERVPPPFSPPIAADTWPWPRRFAIIGWSGVIGYTDLEFPLVVGRTAAGRLDPAQEYETARIVFEAYRNAGDNAAELRRFVWMREQLGLVLTDGGTLPYAATVELISEWRDRQIHVHVAIRDHRYWVRFRGQS